MTEALRGCPIQAEDSEIGHVEQFYFDDESWTVRYLVVNTGGWLSGRKVLIWTNFLDGVIPLREIDMEIPRSIRARLTKEQVENSPRIEADRPVAAQQEVDYYAYHGAQPYWASTWEAAGVAASQGITGPVAPPYLGTDAGPNSTRPAPSEQRGDPHLRSSKEVEGYRIHTRDAEVGHVEDFVVDDEDWVLRYVIVHTRNWLPGKKVLVSPLWISGISWAESEVRVDLNGDEIKTAPEWHPHRGINREYEVMLHSHYGRTPYWVYG